MKNISIFIVLFFFCIFSFINAETSYKSFLLNASMKTNKMWVIDSDGINIRQSPTTNSAIISKIAFGDIVVLLDERIEGKVKTFIGYWQKIKYGNFTGWVFTAYLDYMSFTTEDGKTVDEKFGNYQKIGFGICKEGLNAGSTYSLIKYKGQPITFAKGIDQIDDDNLLIISATKSIISSDDYDFNTMSIGSFVLVSKGKLFNLKDKLPIFNSSFSNPSVINHKIYYWGIDKSDIYAIECDLNNNTSKKVFLYGNEEFATDDMGYLSTPRMEGDEFIFQHSHGTKYILNSQFKIKK